MTKRQFILIFILSLGLVGCATIQSGELPVSGQFKNLNVGDSKEKVFNTIGPPVFENVVGTDFAIYARNLKKNRGFLPPKEVERDVYVLTFNQSGYLYQVDHLTLLNAREVKFDKNQTHTQQQDDSFMKEVIQNFGRYNAGGQDSTVRN